MIVIGDNGDLVAHRGRRAVDRDWMLVSTGFQLLSTHWSSQELGDCSGSAKIQRGSTWRVSWVLSLATRKNQPRVADAASRTTLRAQASEKD